jgi:hypothetical protein
VAGGEEQGEAEAVHALCVVVVFIFLRGVRVEVEEVERRSKKWSKGGKKKQRQAAPLASSLDSIFSKNESNVIARWRHLMLLLLRFSRIERRDKIEKLRLGGEKEATALWREWERGDAVVEKTEIPPRRDDDDDDEHHRRFSSSSSPSSFRRRRRYFHARMLAILGTKMKKKNEILLGKRRTLMMMTMAIGQFVVCCCWWWRCCC